MGMGDQAADEVSYRVIACATDGSDCSRLAGLHAAYLARAAGARLVGVHVVNDVLAGYAGIYRDEVLEQLRAEGRQALAELGRIAAAGGVPFDPVLLEGNPQREITRFAREAGPDLLVVGSHGRTGLSHVLLGSVSASLVYHAPCHTLVVRRRTDQRE